MKTETQIAEENIKERFEQKGRTDWLGGQTMDLEIIGSCDSHKASCQRFLEFLKIHKKDQEGINWIDQYTLEKITDLKQAIKLYDDNGI